MLNVTQVEPASGRILVDGIDITTIGLHDLRSRIVSVQLRQLMLARLSHSNGRPSFHRMPLFFPELCVIILIHSVRSHKHYCTVFTGRTHIHF
jgi:hypothetical protein